MAYQIQVSDISHVIQLAVAPVFLLTGVGTIIGVLSSRLARIVDRSRVLEAALPNMESQNYRAACTELGVLVRRMRLIYLAIALAVVSSLAVGLLIAIAFVDAFLSFNLAVVIASLFVGSVAFIASLVAFLREIYLAVTSARGAIVADERPLRI